MSVAWGGMRRYVHHEGMSGMHPHAQHGVAVDARHNPWSDSMQHQGMHAPPPSYTHEQMAAAQAQAASAAHHQDSPTSASWSAGDPGPPTTWPSASGDELGAAAAWSAAPGHPSHDGVAQNPPMHHPHFTPSNQMVADALYVPPSPLLFGGWWCFASTVSSPTRCRIVFLSGTFHATSKKSSFRLHDKQHLAMPC